MLKTLDRYILKKFLVTYFFITLLFIMIAIVIDISEKMGDFLDKSAPLSAIIFGYFIYFIPWVAAFFAPFFVFLAVIWFTSRMAFNSEIISIIGNGVSFYRLLRPYLIGGFLLTGIGYFANHWLVPEATERRLMFEAQYVHSKRNFFKDINLTIEKTPTEESIVSISIYQQDKNEGTRFTLKHLTNGKLTYLLEAPRLKLMDENKKLWRVYDYNDWTIMGREEKVTAGREKDTVLNFTPESFIYRMEISSAMTTPELDDFIQREDDAGSEKVPVWRVEKFRRTGSAFAILILVFMGVALSSRKVRGGIGFQLITGIVLALTYLFFMQFFTTFAVKADMNPLLAVWLPNLLFGVLTFFLVRWAPK